MKIILTGGTGLIGAKLGKALVERGHEIVLLTRNLKSAKEKVTYPHTSVQWDGEKETVSAEVFKDVDGVVHLAGVGINEQRWNDAFKKRLKDSRILSTALLLKNAPKNLKFFVGASAIGYYPKKDQPMFEDEPVADNFFGQLCKGWEDTAYEFLDNTRTRICHLRTGVVMAPKGGALEQMLPVLKSGLGGPLGNGKQIMSWVDIEDIIGMYIFSIENEKASGPLNAVAPEAVSNKEMTQLIGRLISKPVAIPAPKLGIRMILGEVANYILMSQNISSQKIESLGYVFKFRTIESSLLKNIL